jgi:Protein of unknown function (DUF3703)
MKHQLENEAQLRGAWTDEMRAAHTARSRTENADEWRHLERAHILSQPSAWLHLRTHGAMFAAALRRRDGHEILGQAFRFVVAGPGSLAGRYPVGNTGGADVSAFEPMPIPDDLQVYLKEVSSS